MSSHSVLTLCWVIRIQICNMCHLHIETSFYMYMYILRYDMFFRCHLFGKVGISRQKTATLGNPFIRDGTVSDSLATLHTVFGTLYTVLVYSVYCLWLLCILSLGTLYTVFGYSVYCLWLLCICNVFGYPEISLVYRFAI